jgi:penicillin-binding protein 1A
VAVGQGPPNKRIRRGAVIRVMQEGKDWEVAQMPEIESAFVAASTTDGAIRPWWAASTTTATSSTT